MPIDEKKLQELKAQHGDLVHVLTAAGEQLAVRSPSRVVYTRFREMVLGPRAVSANEQLVNDCALWPIGADLEAVFDRKPALVDTFANELTKLAGAGVAADAKKL